MQQQRPSTAKNKEINENLLKKKKKTSQWGFVMYKENYSSICRLK